MENSKLDIGKKYLIYFTLYSMIGWLYEVLLELLVYGNGFINRGFLFGPYCPVYGFGALIFLFCLTKLKNKKIMVWKINITPLLVFIGIILITTTIELITSYLMEIFTGSFLWDYSHYKIQFQGRIALSPSLRFGLGGMVFIYILQPLFEKLTSKFDKKTLSIVSGLILVIFIVDILFKFI